MDEIVTTATPIAIEISNRSDWLGFAIIQAVGAIGTAIALIFLAAGTFVNWRSGTTAKKAAELSEQESNLRTRPWVGVIGVQFSAGARVLSVQLKNVGALPAHAITFDMSSVILRTEQGEQKVQLNSLHNTGVLFPNEVKEVDIFWAIENALPKWMASQALAIVQVELRYEYSDNRKINWGAVFEQENRTVFSISLDLRQTEYKSWWSTQHAN